MHTLTPTVYTLLLRPLLMCDRNMLHLQERHEESGKGHKVPT